MPFVPNVRKSPKEVTKSRDFFLATYVTSVTCDMWHAYRAVANAVQYILLY